MKVSRTSPRLPLPPYIQKMPAGRTKNREINRFYLRLAALYASPSGTVKELAEMIGINFGTLRSHIRGLHPQSLEIHSQIAIRVTERVVPPTLPAFHRKTKDRRSTL